MKFRYQDTPGGCVGAIELPLAEGGKIVCAACGDDRADALGRAALIAERIASDPIMRALMPPQALVAVQAAKGLAVAAKKGSRALRSLWGRIHGPGKQRLATALHEEALAVEGHGDWIPRYWETAAELGRRKRRKRRRAPVRARAPEPEPELPDDNEDQQDQEDGGDS